jgi:hypothetical protein
MVQRRPTAILVIAILNFVFGGLGIVSTLCLGGTLALYMYVLPETLPGQPAPFPNEYKYLEQELPGHTVYTFATLVLGLMASAVLIVASIGLLRLKNWARWTCAIYAVFSLVWVLANTYYTLRYVDPVRARFAEELQPQLPPGTPNIAGFAVLNDVIAIAVAAVGIAYAVALFVVMFLPNVRAAFAARNAGPAQGETDTLTT